MRRSSRAADDDIVRTAAAGASVAHCPSVFAYRNPESGIQWTPVPELRAEGVDIGLGIDDHHWHDSYIPMSFRHRTLSPTEASLRDPQVAARTRTSRGIASTNHNW